MASDAVFFGAHPDDIELTSGGLAALLASHGHRVTLVDLTRGEAASRGTVAERARESEQAAAALGATRRLNLGLPDTGLDARDRAQVVAVVTCLRAERPVLVVAPEGGDPHPDHGEGASLVTRACYLSGLARFETPGERFRPRCLLYALYRGTRPPRLVVEVSAVWERRMAALRAHASQLAGAPGPATDLTQPDFLPEVEARARHFGAMIGARYGEGYRTRGPLAVSDARALLGGAHAGGPA
jgi:bacillithiol biosynthesis deacetylase BshB1